ncbi:MAG TPA: phosphopantetheine-binding protein, partial [Actinomycetota bacterium]|nr:phosphopantetheine-binding protein [Actinomycetota bacterium]
MAKLAARVTDGAEAGPDEPLAALGIDSLGMAELALAVEDEFGVRLAAAPPERLRTVRDVARAVARLQGRAGGPRLPEGIGRLQDTARRAVGPVLTGWYRFHAEGVEQIPRTGAAVIAANHGSLLDVPFLALACPRDIWFMAK